MCVSACVCVCVHVCVRECVRLLVGLGGLVDGGGIMTFVNIYLVINASPTTICPPFLTEIACPALWIYSEGMVFSNESIMVGTEVNVTCKPKFMLSSAKEGYIESKCNATGSWQPPIGSCICK